ncbi:MAG: hypothetical protein AAFP86_02655, partial [Planctomycetota bacterium]
HLPEADVLVRASMAVGAVAPDLRRHPRLGFDVSPAGEAGLLALIDSTQHGLENDRACSPEFAPARLSRGEAAAVELALEAVIADSLGQREVRTLVSAVAEAAKIPLLPIESRSTRRSHLKRTREDLELAQYRLENWPEFRGLSQSMAGAPVKPSPAGRKLVDGALDCLRQRARARTLGGETFEDRRELLMFDLGLYEEADELEMRLVLDRIVRALWPHG